jgi:DNA-binding MarR family transcriptional regulator
MSTASLESVGFLANQMARLFLLQLSDALAPLGLATAQFAVLSHLWSGATLTQGQLASCLGLEQATMAKTLARMERDGLIERRPHLTDKRARIIHLTRRGQTLKRDAVAAATRANRDALSTLTEAEQQQLDGLLRRVIRHQLLWRESR